MKQSIVCWLVLWTLTGVLAGCVSAPMSTAAASATGAATAAEPMTLPRFLGITSVMRSAHTTVYRSRVRLARHIPLLQPPVPGVVPMALGDPAALQSPAPAVAAAASIQQAQASAPGKIAALNYLGNVDCSQHPQVEEALLASLADPIDAVRIAALQAIVSGQQRCGREANCKPCGSNCDGGCCTPAIHARLLAMASQQNEQGCWCEPNATARRLARQALGNCTPGLPIELPQPEEIPAAETIQALTL